MKKMIGQFFIILALVLTSINVCFPSEVDCLDHLTSSSSSSSSPVSPEKSNGSQEDHHCFDLSCNTLMTSFSSNEVQTNIEIFTQHPFFFKISYYPKVSLSTDKPPTI